MKSINLRDYYPFYKSDYFIEVPNEVVTLLHDFKLREAAYRLRSYRHKAYYSLERNDGIERDILFVALSPYELYERKASYQKLYAAIASLSDKQAKRIYAYYFLGMNKVDIAKVEGVNKSQITRSVSRALKNMEKFLKKLP